MRGIIYVAHGSQKKGKNEKMIDFYRGLKKERVEEQQALAFLEKHPDSLEVVASQMAEEGVTELLIVPLLLFSAMHKEEDIPQQLASVSQKYSHLRISICETFAQEREVRTVLLGNIQKTLVENKLVEPDLFLVAHGSSQYQKPLMVVDEVGQWLSEATGLKVTTGVLYGQETYLEKAKSLLATEDLVVVPFFLFDGHLLDKIKRELAELCSAKKEIYYTETLNLNLQMIPAILRLMEAQS